MKRVTFGKFLENTSTYERMPVQINAGLRRGLLVSMGLLSACMGIYWLLPSGSYLRQAFLFTWTKGWLSHAWDFTADHRSFILVVCGLIIVMTLVLAVPTRLYNIAEINLHILLFIPVVFTALNLGFVIVLLLPVIVNLFIWMLCVLLGLLVMSVVSGIFAATHRSG